MKFYNPFKPHIVKLGDSYAVRRLCFTMFLFWPSWEYSDKNDRLYWWNLPKHVFQYCIVITKEEAVKILQKQKPLVLPKAEYLES